MIATNAFKQAVVGTYTASDTVIELNSISDTVGASDYLPNGGFNLILYDGLFGNPADANNAGKYEIFECTGVNYTDNEITVVRARENTTAVTIDASSWQVVYGATKELLESLTSDWGDIGGTLSDQTDLQNALDAKIPTADIINDLTTGGATKVLSAEQGVELSKSIVTDYDVWYLTTGFSGNADPITANLARNNKTGAFLKGSGMSQASGIFTFPKTGIWEIEFFAYHILNENETSRFVQCFISITKDDSVYTDVANSAGNLFAEAANVITGIHTKYPFNVDNIANDKVRFAVTVDNANVQTLTASGDSLRTYMTFKRIGDAI